MAALELNWGPTSAASLLERPEKRSVWRAFAPLLRSGLPARVWKTRLDALDIVDADSGEKIRFREMTAAQQHVFLERLLAEEAAVLAGKCRRIPELAALWKRRSRRLSRLAGLPVTVSDGADGSISGINDITGSGGRTCFPDATGGSPGSGGRACFSVKNEHDFNYPSRPVSSVLKVWAGKLRKGDIVCALPKHGAPWIYANLNPRYRSKMGHIAIITKDIPENADIHEKCTVECRVKKGVHERALKNWSTPHYVLGVQKIRWVWKWRGAESFLHRETRPVEDIYRLADFALTFLGRKYVKWYEVVICKWVAPARFTCSTLLSYCAEKVYGQPVSNCLFSFSTPSDIIMNPAIYIKDEVR